VSHVKEVCGEVVCRGISEVGDQDAIVDAATSLSSLLDDLVAELPAPVSLSVVSNLVRYRASASGDNEGDNL